MERRAFVRWTGLLCLICSSVAFVTPSNFQSPVRRHHQPLVTRVAVVEDTITSTPEPTPPPPPPKISNETRVRHLRDLMWMRETLEDLTAAEFAISLDQTIDDSRRRKRAVDYDKLLTKLNRRIMDLGCEPKSEDCQLEQIVELTPGKGMGRIVYSDGQRDDLFK